jgi:hypothetical protein
MRSLLTLMAAFAELAASDSATIRGMVVENQTGHPLARTLVIAMPVAGTAGGAATARTDLYGGFAFEHLAPGAYLVTASRKGFATIQFGQKHWKSAGLPVILEENQRMQVEIRLPQLGAIAGRIVDENDVGLPDHELVVYRVAKPPVLVAHATSDDRGAYRVGSLEPGTYLVRTTARIYEEGGYLPTFFREVAEMDQAHTVEVNLDEQVEDVAIRPRPGRLFKLGGLATCPQMPDAVITLTLVSDMGKETVNAEPGTGKFQFNPQAPGRYELNMHAIVYNRAPTPPTHYYGYQEISLDRDSTDLRIPGTMAPYLRTQLEDSRGGRVDFHQVQMVARRKELSGPGEQQKIDLGYSYVSLPPGRWELALERSPAFYASGFVTNGNLVPGRADGWNETVLVSSAGSGQVKFVLSNSPGALHGQVMLASQQVAGVPVFLEASDMEPARRLREPFMTRTDTHGNYQFTGLAPGAYRLLATFEYQAPGAAEFDAARAAAVRVEETRDLQKDLDLFVAR